MFLEEVGFAQNGPSILKVDNKALEYIARDPVMNTNLKHMKRRHFFVREQVENGEIEVCWDYGLGNEADVFTKAMPVARMKELSARLRDSVGALEALKSKAKGSGKGAAAKA